MPALPQIDQATKPAGVPGQSRDDLDLYTVPGTEIQFTDFGGTATSWLWEIIDQPPGAVATLTTPTAVSTFLTNATVPGSYFVQLTTDGGGPGEIYRVVAGIQLNTPSWVIPPLNRPLRIPAKGETFEFNVESSPGVGANARGWAQEMDHWFRTLVDFGFGVRATNAGVPVGSEPFFTLNFPGGGAVDAGGGVLDVPAGGGSGDALTDTRTSNAVLAAGDPVTLNGAGTIDRADADFLFETYGIAVAAAGVGNPVDIVTHGVVTNGAWALTVGAIYYLAVGGGITTTPPSLSGIPAGQRSVVRIGQARTATSLLVRIAHIVSS